MSFQFPGDFFYNIDIFMQLTQGVILGLLEQIVVQNVSIHILE